MDVLLSEAEVHDDLHSGYTKGFFYGLLEWISALFFIAATKHAIGGYLYNVKEGGVMGGGVGVSFKQESLS